MICKERKKWRPRNLLQIASIAIVITRYQRMEMLIWFVLSIGGCNYSKLQEVDLQFKWNVDLRRRGLNLVTLLST